jgi:hypothetical protein
MGDDAEISYIRDGHEQLVNIVEECKGVNPVALWRGFNLASRRIGNIFVGMSEEEKPTGLPKFWIWLLLIILVGLLMVPVISIGLAIQKSGWVPVQRVSKSSTSDSEETEAKKLQESSFSLRDKVERIAASIIKIPTLHPKMEQVQIQAPAQNLQKASGSIHRVLESRNQTFVEAIEPDKIRIVVILPSKDWATLSGSLQVAAEKDGVVYKGPSQTTTANDDSDTMVAEIEILQKPSAPSRKSR